MLKIFMSILFFIGILIKEGQSLNCYRCTSSQPGCGEEFNFLWYDWWGETCPEYDDKCVKIIETKGAERVITRECLSAVRGFRTDVPADKYEGCREASKDVRLGHYVNNSITQLDIHRTYYDKVEFCFCYFHHRCNNASGVTVSILAIIGAIAFKLLA